MISVCHISATPNWKSCNANWGDKALVYATQKRFEEELGQISWTNMDCRKIYTEDDVDIINMHDFVIVGPGGLILPDTFANNVSGWQWGISASLIRKIRIPLIVYAIGWNLFPGQKPSDVMRESLSALSDVSAFISLRHSEDVDMFNEFIGSQKAVLNFCPTITMGDFLPKHTGVTAFNVAGDRPLMRYHDQPGIFNSLLDVVGRSSNPVVVNHMSLDNAFGSIAKGIPNVNMESMSVEDGISFYSGVEYMFATRGHAQMIPFGLGVKVISLISHEKIKRFINDIGVTSTGIDINSVNLAKKCIDAISIVDHCNFQDKMYIVRENIEENIDTIKRNIL